MGNFKRLLCLVVTVFFTFHFYVTSVAAAHATISDDILQPFSIDEAEAKLKLHSKIFDFSEQSENTLLSTATYYNFSVSEINNLPKFNIKRGPEIISGKVELTFEPFPGVQNYEILFSKDGNFENSDYRAINDYSSFSYSLQNFLQSNKWYVYVLAYNSDGKIIAHSDVKAFTIPEDYPISFEPFLEKVVRKAMNKPTGEIYKSDVEKIKVLDASNQGLISLYSLVFYKYDYIILPV